MRLVRRTLVVLLVLVVVGETSGVARAFGPSATVHCCCGVHASARPCRCPDCPVALRRALRHDLGAAQLLATHDCDGNDGGDPGVLHVVAIAPRVPAAAAAPSPMDALAFAAPSPLRGRAVDVGRPPP
ncbi:MAG TPA: hypothetical protein VLU41_03960 [Ideonella sp.]|nr:hypothetical protein [Ideonella sp.]